MTREELDKLSARDYQRRTREDGGVMANNEYKLEKWVSNGAKLTETVTRLCIKNGISGLEKYLPKHGESKNKGVKKKDRQKAN